jgi:hypothetical protein
MQVVQRDIYVATLVYLKLFDICSRHCLKGIELIINLNGKSVAFFSHFI